MNQPTNQPMNQPMCLKCNIRPRYCNRFLIYNDYCGVECAAQNAPKCQNCKKYPVIINELTGRYNKYCCTNCYLNATL